MTILINYLVASERFCLHV